MRRDASDRRLGIIVSRPGGSTYQVNHEVGALLSRIGELAVKRGYFASTRVWRKRSNHTPLSADVLDEIVESVQAVVFGIADCRHGSACGLGDVLMLRARGLRVAFIDTPNRVPTVRRRNGRWVVEYGMTERWAPKLRLAQRGDRAMLKDEMERQGISRALAHRRAARGDEVEISGTSFRLWWTPSTASQVQLPRSAYVETEPLDKLRPGNIRGRAEQLLPAVLAALQPRRS